VVVVAVVVVVVLFPVPWPEVPLPPTCTIIDCSTSGVRAVWSLLTSWTVNVCIPAVTFGKV
jgi:hypothetical protein